MKKFILVSLVFLLIGFSGIGQETLTFRVHNPSVYWDGTNNNLQFYVQVKATASGTYLYSGQANFLYNITEFGHETPLTPTGYASVARAGISVGNNLDDNPKYNVQANLNGDNLNVFVNTVKFNFPAGGGTLADWFNEITTSWQDFARVRVQLLNNTQTAQLQMVQSTMNGMQSYAVSGTPFYLYYHNPNNYSETQNLYDLYLQRIYSVNNLNVGTFTEIGGTLNWANIRNTSVWDSIPTGGTATISNTNCQASNLRIHPGAKLKILPGGELKVAGTTEITEPNGLWIASTSTAAAGTGAFMDNGESSITYNGSATIRVQRYVGQDNWHGIAIPLHSVTAWGSFYQTYLKWYDETRSVNEANVATKWRYIVALSDTTFNGDLKGYMHWASSSRTPAFNTINFTASNSNKLVSGPLTRSVTRTAFLSGSDPFDGFNLVGNMYSSPIDWEATSGWTKTNVDPTIYMWSQVLNAPLGNYATYNGSTHLGTLGGTRYIPAMQGYFIHATAAGTLGMDNNVRVFNSQAFWKDETSYEELIDLVAIGNGSKDEAKVWFNNSATPSFDSDYDNYKLMGDEAAPQLYSLLSDGNIAAVNTLPWAGLNTVVPLGFSLNADAPVTITASNLESFKSGTKIYLEDTKDASMNELTINPVYTFTASATDAVNRFVLHFYNPSWGIADFNTPGLQIYSFDEYVYVRNLSGGNTKGEILIYDQLGRKVFIGKLQDIVLNKYLPDVNEGYYMVRVVTLDNSYTQKVYIK